MKLHNPYNLDINPLMALRAKTSRPRLHCFKTLQLFQFACLNCQLRALSGMSFKLGYAINTKKSVLFSKISPFEFGQEQK